ncbi:MAG TPA: hypothetical protein VFE98_05355 [Candidatus Bathyarchaeia archaeon]|nr:hypothetical protein [Candidatus Bathyarchaeia archaeon]
MNLGLEVLRDIVVRISPFILGMGSLYATILGVFYWAYFVGVIAALCWIGLHLERKGLEYDDKKPTTAERQQALFGIAFPRGGENKE